MTVRRIDFDTPLFLYPARVPSVEEICDAIAERPHTQTDLPKGTYNVTPNASILTRHELVVTGAGDGRYTKIALPYDRYTINPKDLVDLSNSGIPATLNNEFPTPIIVCVLKPKEELLFGSITSVIAYTDGPSPEHEIEVYIKPFKKRIRQTPQMKPKNNRTRRPNNYSYLI